MSRLVCASFVVALAACAGSAPRGQAAPKQCEPKEIPAAWVAAGPVYRSCEVDQPAKAIGTVSVRGWEPSRPSRECNTALIEFVVDTTGQPVGSTARLVRATDAQLGSALLGTVPSRHYTPAVKNGRPVAQVVQESTIALLRVVSVVTSSRGQPSAPALPTGRQSTAGCKP